MTYISTSHTRFEHSLGVMFLAEKLVRELKRKQPKLDISDKDIMCVKIAGLLHDIGHCSYSHIYDGLFRKQLAKAEKKGRWLGQSFDSKKYEGLPNNIDGWCHEDGSLMMIDALLAYLGLEIDEYNLDAPLKQIADGFKAETFGLTSSADDNQLSDFHSQALCDELPHDLVLTSRDWIFIKECIVGGPLPPKGISVSVSKKLDSALNLIGRPNPHKEFLYDVVSNRHSGLDVDKIDYLARDNRRAFGTSGEVDPLLFENAYVAWGKCGCPENCWKCKHRYTQDLKPSADERESMHLMICYPVSSLRSDDSLFLSLVITGLLIFILHLQKKMIQNAMNFFKTRFRNHEYLYTHHNTNAAAYMICDILLLADPFIRLSTLNEGDDCDISNAVEMHNIETPIKLPISRANLNPQSYLLLNDSILDVIAANDCPDLKPARLLLNRYRSHKLYKKIADKPISTGSDCRGFKYLWEEKLWNMSDQEIANTIFKMGQLRDVSFNLTEEDIIVEKRQIHHGKGAENPVNGMRFLSKSLISKARDEFPEHLPEALQISEDDYECCIPRAFLQRTLRIYCRKHDKDVQDFLTTCVFAFFLFMEKNSPDPRKLGKYGQPESDYKNEISNHSASGAVFLSQDSPTQSRALSNQAWSNHSKRESNHDENASKKRKTLYQSLNIDFD